MGETGGTPQGGNNFTDQYLNNLTSGGQPASSSGPAPMMPGATSAPATPTSAQGDSGYQGVMDDVTGQKQAPPPPPASTGDQIDDAVLQDQINDLPNPGLGGLLLNPLLHTPPGQQPPQAAGGGGGKYMMDPAEMRARIKDLDDVIETAQRALGDLADSARGIMPPAADAPSTGQATASRTSLVKAQTHLQAVITNATQFKGKLQKSLQSSVATEQTNAANHRKID